jgi:hypothetical protein
MTSRAILFAIGIVVYAVAAVLLYLGRHATGYPVAPRQALINELFREASTALHTRGAAAKRPDEAQSVELYGIKHDQLSAAASLPAGVALVTCIELRPIYGIDMPGFQVDIVSSQSNVGSVSFGASSYRVAPVLTRRDTQIMGNAETYAKVTAARRDPALVLPDGERLVGLLWIGGEGEDAEWVWPEAQPLAAFIRMANGMVESAAFFWRSRDVGPAKAAVLRTWDGDGRSALVSGHLVEFSTRSSESNRDLSVIGEGMPTSVALSLLCGAFVLLVWTGVGRRAHWVARTALVAALGALGAVAWWRQAPVLAQGWPWDLRRMVLLVEIGFVAVAAYAVVTVVSQVRKNRLLHAGSDGESVVR